ncbi:hypothetical protein HK099_003836 [Clydaea vesicula]|uniref:Uncharacterized protein n=1 Tax=Clydaea vesicula TaxID=447962 RepID=A0AAD5XW18_9FUNG|nr:hypothetical protein HK099_003836 [Clydaea vesicula]
MQTSPPRNSRRPYVDHILLIGVDGFVSTPNNSQFQLKNLPFLKQLMTNGTSTEKCRSIYPTESYPNWGALLHSAPAEITGIDSNSYFPHNPSVIGTEGIGGRPPTLFGVVSEYFKSNVPKDHKLVLGATFTWKGIGEILKDENLDWKIKCKDDATTVKCALEQLNKFLQPSIKRYKPSTSVQMVHLDDVDNTGHLFGWGKKYWNACKVADFQIQQLIDGYRRMAFTMEEILTPLILCCPEIVSKNFILPETSAVSILDITPTVLFALGLSQPIQMKGRPIIEAFGLFNSFNGYFDSVWRFVHPKGVDHNIVKKFSMKRNIQNLYIYISFALGLFGGILFSLIARYIFYF